MKNRQYKKYQVIECFRDPQVLMLFAIVFLQCIPGGGLTAVSEQYYARYITSVTESFSSTKSFSRALATQASNRQWLPCPNMRFSLSRYYSRMFFQL